MRKNEETNKGIGATERQRWRDKDGETEETDGETE